jgi:hypothetical protein
VEAVIPLSTSTDIVNYITIKNASFFFLFIWSFLCRQFGWELPVDDSTAQCEVVSVRISELERKIGQRTMEIDFLKKVLRRSREHPRLGAVHGGTDSMSKSKRRPKRGQS